MGLIAECTQLQMHFKFQVKLACQTLKMIKIDESALFSVFTTDGFEMFT